MRLASLLMALVSGLLFGFGLALSTLIQPEVVLSFLRFHDFGLLLVLGGGIVVTFLAYRIGPLLLPRPIFEAHFGKHESRLSASTIVGAALFGIGWGVSGVCPAPAIAGIGAGEWDLLISVAAMLAGAWVQGWLSERFGAGR